MEDSFVIIYEICQAESSVSLGFVGYALCLTIRENPKNRL